MTQVSIRHPRVQRQEDRPKLVGCRLGVACGSLAENDAFEGVG
jgi:hypothetical protein